MKYVESASLLLAAVVAFGSGLEAQVVGPPNVRSVSSTPWFDPGRVTIHGSNFSMVNLVVVDGRPAEIVKITPSKVIIRPESPTEPGFAQVFVYNMFGPGMGSLPFTPALSAERKANRLDVTLVTGEPSLYTVFFSFYDRPVPARVPGTLYMQMLDMISPASGYLMSGVMTSGERVEITRHPMPHMPGLGGDPMYIQALVRLGFAPRKPAVSGGLVAPVGELFSGASYPREVKSFSNMFLVPGLGRRFAGTM